MQRREAHGKLVVLVRRDVDHQGLRLQRHARRNVDEQLQRREMARIAAVSASCVGFEPVRARAARAKLRGAVHAHRHRRTVSPIRGNLRPLPRPIPAISAPFRAHL